MPLTNLAEQHTLPHVKIRWTKLPFFFDPARLRADLNAIPNSAWVPHFNQNDFTGQWSSVALRSLSGRADDIQPRGHAGQFINTPLAASCPNLERVIDTFAFPKKSVRLLRLHARSRVLEHRDPDLGLVDGEIRIHVPITTNDRLEFVVANRQLLLGEGEAWYIDFSQPHRINNAGDTDRVHLVIDGTVNDWALELLSRSVRELATESFEPDGVRSFRQFREAVFEDPQLQEMLLKITDRQLFLDAVVAAGAARGYGFQLVEAESAYRQSQREWLEKSADL
jgi:Aspartyl/Asparaginyl beta-hydroxylase